MTLPESRADTTLRVFEGAGHCLQAGCQSPCVMSCHPRLGRSAAVSGSVLLELLGRYCYGLIYSYTIARAPSAAITRGVAVDLSTRDAVSSQEPSLRAGGRADSGPAAAPPAPALRFD